MKSFIFQGPKNFDDQNINITINIKITVDDFNSHSTIWGYKENNDYGDRVETWAEVKGLEVIHDPKPPYSFNSG